MTKRFTVRNESFVCSKCGEHNPVAAKTCRNHCRVCFYSVHVDEKFPGDRMSSCGGLMEPKEIRTSSKGDFQIMQRCIACKKELVNKLAEDDSIETVHSILEKIINDVYK